jgi:hypothetical protein
VSFRKDRVSKAAALVSLALALSLLAPSRTPPGGAPTDWIATAPAGRLAYAQPPRLARDCADSRAQLHFEMITDESQSELAAGRGPVICLAAHELRSASPAN